MHTSTVLGSILALCSFASSRSIPELQKRAACAGNTATTRSTWCDFSIDTDYYNEVPDTGVTREFWLNLEQETLSPDGVPRFAMTVNGTVPGPTLIADWGDTIKVHVTNNFPDSSGNGSSIHFHGIRQNFTNQNDGVVSITQCPIAPGNTQTYTWRATQYGHTWYHSHFALQAWEGVFGGIIINGPATSNYDEDLGVLFIQDWDHQTVDEMWFSAEKNGATSFLTGLINGTNVFGEDGASNQTGSRFTTKFNSGTSYRMRLVNAAIDTFFHFSIDNHAITVIANDLVPIQPYETNILPIGIGQRYDIIIQANQADVAQNFWMRAIPQSNCSGNSNPENIKGVVYYGDSPSLPTTSEYADVHSCADIASSNLVPHLSKSVSTPFYQEDETITVNKDSTGTYFRWFINGTTFQMDWGNPTLLQTINGATTFNQSMNLLEIPNANEWVYLVIDNNTPVDHPIHLHGHDFWVLNQSSAAYTLGEALNLNNPTRRDVAMLPNSGHLVLAFQSDNPGAWLAHCHIAFHQSEGFALQILERASEIPAILDSSDITDRCSAWNSYMTSDNVVEEDSGI